MFRFIRVLLIYLCATSAVYAKINFQDIKLQKTDNGVGKVEILFDGDVIDLPRLKFEGRKIHLFVPKAKISSKVVKKMSLGNGSDMIVVGEQFSKKDSRLSISLPYSIKSVKKKVHVNLNGKKMILSVPLIKRKIVKAKSKVEDQKDLYDESYLEKLIKDKNEKTKEKVESDKKDIVNSDMVKSSFSSLSEDKGTFSLGKQIAKFSLFLALVLAIFYGVVWFVKKSVLSKNKLGFLNSTKVVEVINTTYVAPKRSIMLVRIQKQIFLIGSSEKGLHSLGELADVNGLLKEGERAIGGNNFDTSMEMASKTEKEFNLKEMMNVKEKKEEVPAARLRDQIKNKIKGLKSLQ